MVHLLHPYMTTGKTITLTRQIFVGKVMSLFFNMLSRLVITFLSRSKCLLISWLQSPSAVILEPKKIKSATVSIVSTYICHEVMGPDAMILVLWMLSFKPTFSLSFFTFIKRLFSSSSLSVIGKVSSAWQCETVLSDFLQGPCSHNNFLPEFYGSLGLDRRRQWHPTPILLPGKSHGRRSLVGCSPWGH